MQTPSAPEYNTDFQPIVGKTEALAPGVKRVVAPNASPYTFTGTNTYIVGFEEVIVIDPGPDDQSHLDAIIGAIGSAKCQSIVLTHTHKDHSALAPKLAKQLDVPLVFEGAHRPSRPITRFEKDPIRPSCDYDLKPDLAVKDGSKIDLGEIQLTVRTTPGHCANHIALGIDGSDILFSGDHVMGWSSTLIADPDGSLNDYLASLDKVIGLNQGRYFPAHGDIIEDGREYALKLKGHRLHRNGQILDLLDKRERWTLQLLNAMYPDIPIKVRPAALLTLHAHLQYLISEQKVDVANYLFAKKFSVVR